VHAGGRGSPDLAWLRVGVAAVRRDRASRASTDDRRRNPPPRRGTTLLKEAHSVYERIVVALDGSDLAETVLPYVAALAGTFRPSITLVRAYEPPASLMPGMASTFLPGTGPLLDPGPANRAAREEADAYLASVAARLSAAGVPAGADRMDGPAAAGILAVARERHATLIAMTTHGRGGLSRLVFGSVADAVLRAAPCPVLLVRVGVDDQRATGDAVAGERNERDRRDRSARPPTRNGRGPSAAIG
jgi:nucleotide-binding universal stress UspA family protein